jgi:hypothetical protein
MYADVHDGHLEKPLGTGEDSPSNGGLQPQLPRESDPRDRAAWPRTMLVRLEVRLAQLA